MKRLTVVIGVFLVIALLITADSFAQMGPGSKWRGSGGWGMGMPYQSMYEPAKVETVTGTVGSVEAAAPIKRMQNAVMLMLKTDKEIIPVHLGPAWFIERLDIKIQKGDVIEVKGSRVTFSGKPAIIAAKIKKGEQVLNLRDDEGIPVWAGWRRQ